eukprot:TRINITY_DN3366_c0_g1_i6.p1 TRINITY_DN3366_c0_g1~~TRINITY_DN3366_c0_g1_i6.p1  ORF type:complete len:103 (+),score=3.31 TRINITY_DN3366_c0_g1_i6:546-854(+)
MNVSSLFFSTNERENDFVPALSRYNALSNVSLRIFNSFLFFFCSLSSVVSIHIWGFAIIIFMTIDPISKLETKKTNSIIIKYNEFKDLIDYYYRYYRLFMSL